MMFLNPNIITQLRKLVAYSLRKNDWCEILWYFEISQMTF